MAHGVDGRLEPEARVTALFELVASLVSRVASDLTDLPMPALALRRAPRPLPVAGAAAASGTGFDADPAAAPAA